MHYYWTCKYCGIKKDSEKQPVAGQCLKRMLPNGNHKPHEWVKGSQMK